MLLRRAIINNYRNFISEEFYFNEKSLVIGSNDVGKTNLIDAIRLLLDKGLSENDLDPSDEDFCALVASHDYSIILHFIDAKEGCIQAKFPGDISDDKELYLAYYAKRDGLGGKKNYQLKAGRSIEELHEIQSRFYLKVLNMKYVAANRNIDNFLRSQKNKLLENLKSHRTKQQEENDESLFKDTLSQLGDIQGQLDKLSFIKTASSKLSEELEKLAEHHSTQEIKLGYDIPKANDLLKKIQLLSSINEQAVQVGGDGRKNQSFLALWAALNQIENSEQEPEEISIFCIEEPEAHLHPHQQRKLSEYLINNLSTQVLLTSHSPFIASEFDSSSLIRLYSVKSNGETKAAQKGASKLINEKIINLEFRLNVISSEVYFSDCVLLVEGSSEVILYKALASRLSDFDLDKLNISILSVEGVGFKRYIELFDTLGIPWVVRTDNDYFKIKKSPNYRLAGLQRCVNLVRLKHKLSPEVVTEELLQFVNENEDALNNLPNNDDNYRNQMYMKFYDKFKDCGIYIAKIGLEEDLFNTSSRIKEKIREYLDCDDEDSIEDVIGEMKKQKSTFMFHFIKAHLDCLSDLEGYAVAEPLLHCKKVIKELHNVQSNSRTN